MLYFLLCSVKKLSDSANFGLTDRVSVAFSVKFIGAEFQALLRQRGIKHILPTPSMWKNKSMIAERAIRSLRVALGRSGQKSLAIMLPRIETLFNEHRKSRITGLTASQTTNDKAPLVLAKTRMHRAKLMAKTRVEAPVTMKKGATVLLRIGTKSGMISSSSTKSHVQKYHSTVYVISKVLHRQPRDRYILVELENPNARVEGSFPPSQLKVVSPPTTVTPSTSTFKIPVAPQIQSFRPLTHSQTSKVPVQ